MKILYIGREEKGAILVNDVASNLYFGVDYTGFIGSAEKLKNLALNKAYKYNAIIIDIEDSPLSKEDIVSVITAIKNSGYKGSLILKALGYKPTSEIIVDCTMAGVRNAVLSMDISTAKKELTEILKGKENLSKEAIISNPLLKTPENINQSNDRKPYLPKNKPCKTIGIAGAGNRIGVTTQALQIVRFLNMNKKKACYVQLNNTHFVENLVGVYDNAFVDKEIGKVSYDGIDMFFDREKLSNLFLYGYDYYIYDYGNILNKNFECASYEEKNIKILVAGVKPNEIINLDKSLDRLYQKNINYIFSFTPKSDRDDIREYLDNQAVNCCFTSYTPDMFMFNNNNSEIYEKILSISPIQVKRIGKTNNCTDSTETKGNKKEKKRRKGFFSKKG